MSYLFVSRLYDSIFATYHSTFEDLQREVGLIEKEYGPHVAEFKLNFIDPKALDQECGLAAYPHGTALVVRFDVSLGVNGGIHTIPAYSPSKKPTIEWPKLESYGLLQGNCAEEAEEAETYVSPFNGKVS